jgi:hypothetical protein
MAYMSRSDIRSAIRQFLDRSINDPVCKLLHGILSGDNTKENESVLMHARIEMQRAMRKVEDE